MVYYYGNKMLRVIHTKADLLLSIMIILCPSMCFYHQLKKQTPIDLSNKFDKSSFIRLNYYF